MTQTSQDPAIKQISGHCLCGKVSYEISTDPVWTAYCHCGICRRSSGAPVVAWALFGDEQFKWTGIEPRIYPSSEQGRRYFCGECGTHLAFTSDNMPGMIDVTACTFEDSTSFAPALHVWHSNRLRWFEVSDDLPRYESLPEELQ